jgi:hypothetical protein
VRDLQTDTVANQEHVGFPIEARFALAHRVGQEALVGLAGSPHSGLERTGARRPNRRSDTVNPPQSQGITAAQSRFHHRCDSGAGLGAMAVSTDRLGSGCS